jgi:pilus assembly protein CpaF
VCDDLLAGFLSAAVRARANMIVAGGTGTGKTTMLRCLINEIPADERLITVEDSLEIGLERFEDLHPDHETLEAREANTEGVGAFTLADLVRSALRMDPQRVIVGEVRGAEVLPMLLAMSPGQRRVDVLDPRRLVQGRVRAARHVRGDDPRAARPRGDEPARRQRRRPHRAPRLGRGRAAHHQRPPGHRHGRGRQVVSNELWRPDDSARRARPRPHPELTDKLERYGFDVEAHAAAEGWWR